MNKVAAVLAVSFFGATLAFGGTISFAPQGDTTIFNNPTLGPTTLDYVLTLNNDATFPEFTAIVATIGVNGGPNVSFAIDPAFEALFTGILVDQGVDAPGNFTSDILIDGFVLAPLFGDVIPLPQTVGTLTINALGVAEGDFMVDILQGSGLGDVNTNRDDFTGTAAMFTVVPEPATISLLALGALGLLRRRKTA